MILNDKQIEFRCTGTTDPMISPFYNKQSGKPSMGLGSFGYDITLGGTMLVPSGGVTIMDPLNFNKQYTFNEIDCPGCYDIAPNSFILAESVEYFSIPNDICGVVWGKSTYARCGLLCNVTPLEPGWKGILTMELANVGHLPIRVYVGEGIAQVVFFAGDRPRRTYSEKEAGGMYQNQTGVTPPL